MRKAIVVGAGLAGMVTARSLKLAGYEVTILEAGDVAGGKAGSRVMNGRLREHGYHIFPAWYLNVRDLLESLNIELVDFDRFYYLKKKPDTGPLPPIKDRFLVMRSFDSLGALIHNVFSGLAPWPEVFLQAYFVVDALAERMSRKHFMDRISRTGLLRSRWYASDDIARLEGESTLKASAVPAYEMSAMTAKLVTGYWLKKRRPFLSILTDDMQRAFIEPLVREVDPGGEVIQYGQAVTAINLEGDSITCVTTANGVEHHADYFVVTTPLEVTRTLMQQSLIERNPDLGNFEHLEVAPMTAIHMSLNKVMEDLPPQHIFFKGGRYGLSVIDQRHHWPGLVNSELSFISSNFVPLSSLDDRAQFEILFSEIQQYLDIEESDIEDYTFLSNLDVPLFINTVGAWPSRPQVSTPAIDNLFFAGDWVRNRVDLASMEGAVSSAINAARAVDLAANGHSDLPEARVPRRHHTLTMKLFKALLFPLAVIVWVLARLGVGR